jgi:mono/diheme cytochrome c family protein
MTPNQIFVRNLVGVATTIAAVTTAVLWLAPPSRQEPAPTFRDSAPEPMDRRSPVELGASVFEAKGCVACHSTDGSPRVGPTLKGSWGTDVVLGDGITLRFDADYVRRSLSDPQAQARAGYPPAMPSYGKQLTKREIDALIAFLESLR